MANREKTTGGVSCVAGQALARIRILEWSSLLGAWCHAASSVSSDAGVEALFFFGREFSVERLVSHCQ